MEETNVRQVERFYEHIWNRGDLSCIRLVLHPDVTFRGSLGTVLRGHQEFLAYVDSVRDALGDYRCEIVTLVNDVDRVAARMRFSGVHRGSLRGYAATGKPVSWAGAAFFTFGADGLMHDIWVLGDLQALDLQLAGPEEA
jgi:predicted ester cyclase